MKRLNISRLPRKDLIALIERADYIFQAMTEYRVKDCIRYRRMARKAGNVISEDWRRRLANEEMRVARVYQMARKTLRGE